MGIKVTVSGSVATRVWDVEAMRLFAQGRLGMVKERTFNRGIGSSGKQLSSYNTDPMTVTFGSPLARRLAPKGGQPAYGRGHPRRFLNAAGRDTRRSSALTSARASVRRAEDGNSVTSARAELQRASRSLRRSNTADTRASVRAAQRALQEAERSAARYGRLAGRQMRDAERLSKWAITGRHYPGGYAEYKRSSRRGIGNAAGAGAPVDLILSGQMMRSFRVIRVQRTVATIGLTGAAREYGGYVDERRPFMGMSPEDVADSQAEFAALCNDAAVRSARGAR